MRRGTKDLAADNRTTSEGTSERVKGRTAEQTNERTRGRAAGRTNERANKRRREMQKERVSKLTKQQNNQQKIGPRTNQRKSESTSSYATVRILGVGLELACK